MTPRGRTLMCSANGAVLSERASEDLSQLVRSGLGTEVRPGKSRWGASWRCPADGSPMTPAEGGVTWTNCRLTLPERLLYQLTEFNYHPSR